MATTINHVNEYENELNDNLYNLKMSNNNNNKKVSNARRMRKILKPLLRYLKKKSEKFSKVHHKSQQQQKFEIFTEDVDNENNCNEALEQRLVTDLNDAEEGSAITICIDGRLLVVPIVPDQLYIPVHFVQTPNGLFYWTHINPADNDVCYKERAFSQNQLPEMQVA